MDKRLRILFLTPRLPYPTIGGDRLKPNFILRHLAKNHDVTLVSLYQGGDLPKSYVREIEKFGIKTHVITLDPFRAGIRTGLNIMGRKPLEIDYYFHPDFKQLIKELDIDNNFDLAFAFFMRTAEYIKDNKIKKILMAEDCRTIYQKRSYEESANIKQKMVRLWEYRKLQKYEPDIVKFFDITTLVSQEDVKSMQELNPGAEFRLLTNGTDISKFVMPPGNTERHGILFAGKLDVWANELMIKSIINDILPLIREKVPDAELTIAGAKPPQSIMSLKGKGIYICPDVPDMLPYLQNSALFLHPHKGGSGIQNKLLEAMAAGCPVVTTPTGNQGIGAVNGESALIGRTPEELARHAIKVLTDPNYAKSISQKAHELVVSTHSWEAVFGQLDDILGEMFD